MKGKVILITGASGGIGEAAAVFLAQRGARLALAARRSDRLTALAERLHRDFQADVLPIQADVSREADVKNMVGKTLEKFGRLDVLVNNAAILRMAPLLDMPDSDIRDLLETNFWSLIHTSRAAAPAMLKQGGGHIINVGSGAGRRGLPFMAVYTATKFALTGLTESMRVELALKKIAFTTIHYGGVDTEMPGNLDRSRLPEAYPSNRKGKLSAEAAARAILRAIDQRPPEIYCPFWVRHTAWLSVLVPGFVDWVLVKAYRKALA